MYVNEKPTIAIKIASSMGGASVQQLVVNLLLCGLVSAITVGGKAIGKALGLNYSVEIVTIVAKILSLFSRSSKKNKNSAKKKAKKVSSKAEKKDSPAEDKK